MQTNPPTFNIVRAGAGVQLSSLAASQSSQLEIAFGPFGPWTAITNVPALTDSHFAVPYTNSDPAAFVRLCVR